MDALDFTDLTPTEFEEFCFELLGGLSGVHNVDWRKGTPKPASPADRGRDMNRPGFDSVLFERMSYAPSVLAGVPAACPSLLEEAVPEHETEWAAINHVAVRLGVVPETLRKWKRRCEVDAGAEHTHLREHRQPSESVKIWMSAYNGNHHAAANIYGFDATTHEDEELGDPERGSRNIWTVTHSFGPVVFQIFGTDIPGFAGEVESAHRTIKQIWPYTGSFTWMPRPCFNDRGLAAFGNGIGDELRARVAAAP